MKDIAIQNGISSTIYHQRLRRGWTKEKAATKPVIRIRKGTEEFAVYRGEEFICMGTLQECADHMGVSIKTMSFYTFPVYQRRVAERKNPRNYITVTELDDLD